MGQIDWEFSSFAPVILQLKYYPWNLRFYIEASHCDEIVIWHFPYSRFIYLGVKYNIVVAQQVRIQRVIHFKLWWLLFPRLS